MSQTSAPVSQSEDGDRTQTTYSYANLCANHFRSSNPLPQFSRKEPRSPLLKSTPDDDLDVVLRVWRTMLRFMNDSAGEEKQNVKTSSKKQKKSTIVVMPRLRQEFSKVVQGQNRTSIKSSDECGRNSGSPEVVGGSESKKMKNGLKKRLSLNSSDRRDEILNVEDQAQTGFDQMQFIIGVGILRQELRDEIFCQILRQLTNNTQKTGRTRLWNLLTLMIGVFCPTKKIFPYVEKFIDDGSAVNSNQTKKLLTRIQLNGPRFQPPSKVEYLAVIKKQPIDLQVTLMDSTNHSILSDPCTTSGEIIKAVAETVELEETFGFSLFISMNNKASSLGATGDKVFDAISHCEQIYLLEFPDSVQTVPWRLFIRKEMFSPWDDITDCHLSTNLVYCQIVRGIMLGEYTCVRDSDLAAVAAMQYYIEYENDVTDDNLYSSLPYYIPSHKLTGEDSIRIWCKQVSKFLGKLITVYSKSDDNYGRSPDDVKAELVAWAKRKWPRSFSRYFDVTRLEGPRWSSDRLILGVNSKGISLSTSKGDVGMDATYPQIASVMGEGESHDTRSMSLTKSVIIVVFADGTLVKFESSDAGDIYRLIKSNMAGLVNRSRWAVAKEEFTDITNTLVSCIEGDLIQLSNPAEGEALSSPQCNCTNMATGEEGKMLTSLLHILPCIEEPTDDILRLFRSPNYYVKRSVERSRPLLETSAEVHESTENFQLGLSNSDKEMTSHPQTQIEFNLEPRLWEIHNGASTNHGDTDRRDVCGNPDEEESKLGDDEDGVVDEAELSSIGFDKDFFNALSLYQNEDENKKAVAKKPGQMSYV